MRLRLSHMLSYRYPRPVRSLIQVLRLTPRAHAGQHILSWRIEPSADGRLRQQEDAFGNLVHVFSADGAVEALTLKVSGEVETVDTQGVVRGTVERLHDLFYLRDTDLASADAEIRAFARSVAGDVTADPLSALHRLLAAVHGEVAVDTDPAQFMTTAAKAFAARRATPHDLAHVFIAAARSLELPARFVAGYVRRPEDGPEPEAGHAWAEAKVPGLGWVGFDPTSGLCPTDSHIRVAVGLDHLGAAPVRGSRSTGEEQRDAALRVETAERPSPPPHPPSAQRQTQA